ncbi:MAG TPA: LUD domain-containing protein [Terrimicrobiaceae bacterium]
MLRPAGIQLRLLGRDTANRDARAESLKGRRSGRNRLWLVRGGTYLEEFVGKLEARGAKVHWASTGGQARQIILDVIREKKARSIMARIVRFGRCLHPGASSRSLTEEETAALL